MPTYSIVDHSCLELREIFFPLLNIARKTGCYYTVGRSDRSYSLERARAVCCPSCSAKFCSVLSCPFSFFPLPSCFYVRWLSITLPLFTHSQSQSPETTTGKQAEEEQSRESSFIPFPLYTKLSLVDYKRERCSTWQISQALSLQRTNQLKVCADLIDAQFAHFGKFQKVFTHSCQPVKPLAVQTRTEASRGVERQITLT